MKYITGIITICALIFLNACIENDIPYPRIKAEILMIEAEGQLEEPVINKNDRTVFFSMDEEVDLEKVRLLGLEVTEDAIISPDLDSTSVIDLSSPRKYTLSIYQDYVWTISAEPVVERYFKVNNQVGAEFIDVQNKVAIAYVEEGTDLSAMTIQRLKLGPASATIIPKIDTITDFTETGGVTVVLIYRNIREVWTLFVAEGETSTHSVDAWERVAWLKGSGRADGDNGFEYRQSGSDNWIKVDASLIEEKNGVFSARLSGLSEGATYVSRAYSDEDYSEEVTFTTGTSAQLPNSSFENWSQSGKVWFVHGEGEEMFWDTGNTGAATLSANSNITTYDENTSVSGKGSIKMESKYIVLKFAAGNVFAGKYKDTYKMNGILDFGRPFTKHPTTFSFWYKCNVSTMTHVGSELANQFTVGQSIDEAHIYVALGDWNEPVEINTYPSERKVFDPNSPHVIAYGNLIVDKTVSNWTKHTIELEYRATDRTPKYIVIVASASRWGEYFTGSTSNILWMDDVELGYD